MWAIVAIARKMIGGSEATPTTVSITPRMIFLWKILVDSPIGDLSKIDFDGSGLLGH